ncbi:MAG TPA: copper transporter [Armatimonadota bacterium]|nr:copper transporter [Armatimonadota bacterium]
MRDFRFHLASLIAVFLALGVGMFIGYGVSLSIGVEPLRAQINAVRRHDNAVEDENKQLQQTSVSLGAVQGRLQHEVKRLAILSISGRLANRTVALVSVGPPPAQTLLDSIWNTLYLAGARRLNETIIRGSLVPPDVADAQEILSRIHAPPGEAPADAIAQALGQTIATGTDPLLPAALVHRNAALDRVGDYNVRPDLVVLLSRVESQDRLHALQGGETPETPLVSAFEAQNVRVVECESSASAETAATYFRRLGVSSVDDVETPEGQVSLVWAALGYAGHYGTRVEADFLLPGITRP